MTPRAPMRSPTRSEWVSEASDLARISASSLAQFNRYTVWITTASIALRAIARRKAAKSCSLYLVGLHMRGD